MKNILNKIYFHPLFLISVFIFILIGKFRFLSCFMLLICVHELGHIFMSLLFKWEIEKIIILPFGGLTKYNQMINTKLIEEFLVAISGIILQIIFYKFISNYIDYKYFAFINYFIIIFNLIPIYPLDGAKIIHVFFNILTTFKNSILLTIILSYICIIILSISLFNINKLIIMVFIFLFLEVKKLYKEKDFIFNKFLLERYLNKIIFKRQKIIRNINGMKRDYRHLFLLENKYLTENFFLKEYFEKKNKKNVKFF